MSKTHIALLMMLKNEEKRLRVSLDSIIGYVDSMIIYDTGSTDNTINILKEFSEKHNIPLRLKQGEFVNFCVSRNISLEFADTFDDVDYLLLLDCNDVLKGGENLLKLSKHHKDDDKATAFLLTQEWWSGNDTKYFNVRFVKARKGWRYKGSVHEYITCIEGNGHEHRNNIVKAPDDIILFQDRTQDDDKSGKRFTRDKELLLKDHEEDPHEPRTLFYLAQTCGCLNQNEEALKYYMLRVKEQGFFEEIFHAYLRAGELSIRLNKDWSESMGYFMKAFEKIPRVEPLLYIAQYYSNLKNFHLAYMFANLACCLQYPSDLILFVDKLAYTFKRWDLMSYICLNYKRYEQGKQACLLALKQQPDAQFSKINLGIYEQIEKDKQIEKNKTITKTEFIDNTIKELQKTRPTESIKKLTSIANIKWKQMKENKENKDT